MTWTIAADPSAMVVASLLDGDAPPVFAYIVREADRAGGISIPRCQALKIPPGGCSRQAERSGGSGARGRRKGAGSAEHIRLRFEVESCKALPTPARRSRRRPFPNPQATLTVG